MRKTFILIFLVITAFFVFPEPEAKAIDPVTIALLTPVAIKVAKEASPYIIRGLLNAGKGMLKMGKDVIDIFRLPIGFFQATFLMPWQFKPGVRNIVKGGIAPFKLALHALLLPVLLTGINFNM